MLPKAGTAGKEAPAAGIFLIFTLQSKPRMEEHLTQHIESLIFVTDSAISLKDIRSCLEETFETTFTEE